MKGVVSFRVQTKNWGRALIGLGLLLLLGCSNGSNTQVPTRQYEALIVGKWVDELGIVAEFKADKTFVYDYGNGDIENGTYVVKDSILTTINADGTFDEVIRLLTKQQMVLEFVNIEDKTVSSTYTRLE